MQNIGSHCIKLCNSRLKFVIHAENFCSQPNERKMQRFLPLLRTQSLFAHTKQIYIIHRTFHVIPQLLNDVEKTPITSVNTLPVAQPNTTQTNEENKARQKEERERRAERFRGFLDTVEKYKYVTSVILLSCLTAAGMLLYWLDERFFKHVGDKSSSTFRGIYTSAPKKSIKKREQDEKALHDAIFDMESREIMVVVGPQDSGKTILLESILSNDYDFRVCHIKMAQVNDTQSFAEAVRLALSTNESVERFLLNTIFTKREELAKQHQISNADPLTKTLKEFAENVSNPSHILNIDLLESSNPNRQTILFIDDFDALLPVLRGPEDKELRSKLIALFQIVGRAHGIKLVLCSSQGEVNKLIAAGKAEDMTVYYFTQGLHSQQEAKEFFLKTRKKKADPVQIEAMCVHAYPILGGNIVDWLKLSHNMTEDTLKRMQYEMSETIKIIKSRKMPKRGLFDEPKWTDDHLDIVFRALVRKCGDKLPCNGFHDDWNIGVSAFELEKRGVPWSALESLCHYNALCYNPVTHCVTFPSALMEYMAVKYPKLWQK
jgi:ABC-type iron transport system FetAB ATPase subunit